MQLVPPSGMMCWQESFHCFISPDLPNRHMKGELVHANLAAKDCSKLSCMPCTIQMFEAT